MSAMWEVQKALYDALKADSTFMNLINNKLYDEPETNEDYPYVTIGEGQETTANRLSMRGYDNLVIFNIFTKPHGLGFYPAKQINAEMVRVLDHKKFTLENYVMVICKYENAIPNRDGDTRILHSRFRVITHSNELITY
jgi:hypothetical protein